MRHGKRGRGAAVSAAVSEEWADVQAHCLWPDQALYELVRPVVLLGKPVRERARETGVSEKTLTRRTHQFIQHGLPGFRAPPGLRDDDGRLLPSAVRDFLLVRKAEWPALSAFVLARLCAVRFDRETSYRTVARLLAREPLPSGVARRFPRYSEILDPEERRLTVIRLHGEGWTDTNIAQYLSVSRQTVHSTLRRWVEEGVSGLADKPHVRKRPRKTTLPVMATIRTLQENPGLGAFRMHAALKQLGIALSPATCGRIMALNRKLYDLATAKPVSKPRKPMPFAATRPHQYWSVDIRYIERHNVPEYAQQPIYIITILDNYSRAIVASASSPTQNLDAFLLVLFTAIHVHGAPEALVSDGGSVFRANQSIEIYERLSIRKEQIERRRPYQNYVETHFNILRRMADYYFAQATSWEEFCAIHAKFVADYNWQEHAAHQDHEEGQRAPREVLAWFRGRQVEREVLDELFRALHHLRHIDRHGYIQYRYWRLYGEEALAGKEVAVWLFRDTLTIAYNDEPAVQYAVTYDTDAPGVEAFRRPRPYQTFASVDELRFFPSHHSYDSGNSHSGTSQAPFWDREILYATGWRRIIQVTPRLRSLQRRSSTVYPSSLPLPPISKDNSSRNICLSKRGSRVTWEYAERSEEQGGIAAIPA